MEQLAQTVTGMAHEHGGRRGGDRPRCGHRLHHRISRRSACSVRRASEGGSWHVRVPLARTAMWMQPLPRVLDGSMSGLEGSVLAAHGIEMTTEWGRLQRLGPVPA